MKILVLNGAPRKRNTAAAIREFTAYLETKGDIACETINLAECHIEPCRGCVACFDKGEEHCPSADEVKDIISKIDDADGVVFASPVYAFHLTGQMKNFFDRLSFIFHRPRFFGKISTSIVTQGIYGGRTVTAYLSFVGRALGFTAVTGRILQTLEPCPPARKTKNSRLLRKLADSYHRRLKKNRFPAPSLFALVMFRIGRTKIGRELDHNYRDYTYYKDKGWFESGFYYPVRLGLLKKIAGNLTDFVTGLL